MRSRLGRYCTALLALVLVSPVVMCRAGDPPNYSKQNLSGRDFSNGNLKGANFEGANLSFAKFPKAVLNGANFKGANLQFVDFTGAILDDADFTGADLRGASLQDARAWRTKMAGTLVELAGMLEAEMESFHILVLYDNEKLPPGNADAGLLSFHNADLHDAVIVGNGLRVDFRGADLRGADLTKTTNIDTARFEGAKYDAKTKWPSDKAPKDAVLAPDEGDAGKDKDAAKPAQ